jgi:hypothetical protein
MQGKYKQMEYEDAVLFKTDIYNHLHNKVGY